jgi:hypothetical protein
VRNGPHGYSPFVGRFCGKESPPEITSSGRELWIRFNSDETIELNGFRIVYRHGDLSLFDNFDNA